MKKTLAILASALTMSAAFAQTAAPAGTSAPAMAAAQGAGKASHEQRVEERIKYLHTQLKITSAQESQWNAFADVMRSNGETMGKLFEARHANPNVSALGDWSMPAKQERLFRYRLLVYRGAATPEQLAARFEKFVETK